MKWIAVTIVAAASLQGEPAARRLTPAPMKIEGALGHISAAGELAGGGVLVTDAKAPAIWLIAAGTGTVTRVGSSGGGELQYIQPGGIYRGANKSTLVLDRAQAKVLVLSASGAIERAYSVAERGVTGSSSLDVDFKRLDARNLTYFVDRDAGFRGQPLGTSTPAVPVVRFDPATQLKTPVIADLRMPEQKARSGGENVVLTQQVIGSPADAWGVTPDGRVAIVRSVPYRVEWISPDRKVTRGPAIPYEPIPLTDADKQAFAAKYGRGGMGGGAGVGGPGRSAETSTPPERLFAATKPPFVPDEVLVSPEAKVWVPRSSAHDATEITYDVFDAAAARVDRVRLPATSRVVGFGAGAIYVREVAQGGGELLRKYLIK